MPVLPPLKALFDAQHGGPPMPADMPPAALRAMLHDMIDRSYGAFVLPHDPVAIERDILISVEGGEITLRVYRATTDAEARPAYVYYHGGGFFLGTLDQSDRTCRALAKEAGCVVVSVDYRLAPEHRFPIAADDSYAALCWVADHAVDLAIDPTRIAVGGASAGGNLAAVVAQMARDRDGPAIVAQVLEIPVTDFTSAQTLDFPDEGIRIESTKAYGPIYLRSAADASDPLASPLLAETLDGLPPALVMCAEYDQLQPEGAAYARRLEAAGVRTVYRCWEGQFHGSQNLDTLIPDEAAAYRAAIVTFLTGAWEA